MPQNTTWDSLKIPFKFVGLHISQDVYRAFKRAGIPPDFLDQLSDAISSVLEQQNEYFRQSFLVVEQWAERVRPQTMSEFFVASMGGALVAATTSPPYRPWYNGHLQSIQASVGTAGSTSTVLTLKDNGSTVTTLTIPAASTTASAELDPRYLVTPGSTSFAWELTTAGTGAKDLSVQGKIL